MWYRGYLVIDEGDYPEIECRILFDIILSHIHQLEEKWIDIVNIIYPNTIITNIQILFEDEFECIADKLELVEKQEIYAVAFTIVTYKLYGTNCMNSITWLR